MAKATWDDEPQPRRTFRWKGWLLGLAIAAGLVALLTGVAAGIGTSNRRLAWPLLLNVAGRLQTEEGARDLWQRNPDLADTWGSEEAFLAMARQARAHVQRLPKQEPRNHAEAWMSSGPEQLRVMARVPDGPWLHVYANTVDGKGEGIWAIHLDEHPAFEAQFKAMSRRMGDIQRRRMDRILVQLSTDPEATTFLARETGLDAAALQPWLAQVQAFRHRLPDLRKDLAREERRVRRRNRQILFHHTTTVEFEESGGAGIRLEYNQGRLNRLRLKQPGEDW